MEQKNFNCYKNATFRIFYNYATSINLLIFNGKHFLLQTPLSRHQKIKHNSVQLEQETIYFEIILRFDALLRGWLKQKKNDALLVRIPATAVVLCFQERNLLWLLIFFCFRNPSSSILLQGFNLHDPLSHAIIDNYWVQTCQSSRQELIEFSLQLAVAHMLLRRRLMVTHARGHIINLAAIRSGSGKEKPSVNITRRL